MRALTSTEKKPPLVRPLPSPSQGKGSLCANPVESTVALPYIHWAKAMAHPVPAGER